MSEIYVGDEEEFEEGVFTPLKTVVHEAQAQHPEVLRLTRIQEMLVFMKHALNKTVEKKSRGVCGVETLETDNSGGRYAFRRGRSQHYPS